MDLIGQLELLLLIAGISAYVRAKILKKSDFRTGTVFAPIAIYIGFVIIEWIMLFTGFWMGIVASLPDMDSEQKRSEQKSEVSA